MNWVHNKSSLIRKNNKQQKIIYKWNKQNLIKYMGQFFNFIIIILIVVDIG